MMGKTMTGMRPATARGWLCAAMVAALVFKVGMAGVWTGSMLGAGEASAAEPKEMPAKAVPPSKVTGQPAVGNLLSALEERQEQLDTREREIARRAERLARLEADVTSKIGELEKIERRLSSVAAARRTSDDQAAQSLAKIYAAMKPTEAAPILNQLDDSTVLTIFARMKEKQIGEILPLMSRARAIVLTQAIALRR